MTEKVEVSVEESLRTENAELTHRVLTLEESWDEAGAAMLRLRAEDQGWNLWSQAQRSEDGFTLKLTKDLAKEAELQSAGNPLLYRGFHLRRDGVFSKGVTLEGKIAPRFQRLLDRSTVNEVLFTPDGFDALEKSCYAAGNLFIAYNNYTNDMIRIPFAEITDRVADPDIIQRTAYYLWDRTRNNFDGTTDQLSEWIPVVEWREESSLFPTIAEINNKPVNSEWTIIDMRVNVPINGHWGIPDCFPAMPYSWGYSEYIRDAASLLKALNLIAWKVVGKTQKNARAAGQMLSASKAAGGVAAMTQETQLTSMPRSGQVDMNDGLALAAMAASALEVSVSALLSNAATGGGYGAVSSLDGPTVAMARARQARWIAFYARVFRAMGIKDVTVDFPKITEDPIHRQIASLTTVRATGGIHADEYRAAVIEILDITPLHDEAPDVMEYAQAQNALGFINAMQKAIDDEEAQNDPRSRVGNSGVAGSLSEHEDTNRNMDRKSKQGNMADPVD